MNNRILTDSHIQHLYFKTQTLIISGVFGPFMMHVS